MICIYILFVFAGLFSRLSNLCMCLLCCRDEKIAIMREKHSALMRPVVFALDHVCSITAAPAETPHETWFQQTYGSDIISALERLKNPTNPANPASSWLPFKQVSSLYILIYSVFLSVYFSLLLFGYKTSQRTWTFYFDANITCLCWYY